MNECVLVVNEEEYQLAEIEFYYFKEGEHEDIFAHCDEKQLESNKFYFHGSGMDITYGNNDNGYGGILLRSLIKMRDGEIVDGPYKILTEFLHNANISNSNNKLELIIYLKEIPKKYNKILTSIRVGLSLNEESNCGKYAKEEIKNLKEDFIFKPYRYLLNEEKLLLKLLSESESGHFLAVMIKDKNISSKLISKVEEKIKYINGRDFLNIKDEKKREKRELFMKKVVGSNKKVDE